MYFTYLLWISVLRFGMSKSLNKKILSDITVYMKYAKYLPELNRRETWEELVTRNKEMHQKRYPELYNAIEENYRYVYKKKSFTVNAIITV